MGELTLILEKYARFIICLVLLLIGTLYQSRNDLAIYASSITDSTIYESDFLFNQIQTIFVFLVGPDLVITFLQIMFLLVVLRSTKSLPFQDFLLILISTAFITTYFNAIRSGLAFFICISAINNSNGKINIRTLVIMLSSILIHKSAIILIGMYFLEAVINIKTIKYQQLIVISILTALIMIGFFYLAPSVYERYQFYFSSQNTITDGRYGIEKMIYWGLLTIFALLATCNARLVSTYLPQLFPLICMTLICLIFTLFIGVNELVSRLLIINSFWLMIISIRVNAPKNLRMLFAIVSITSPSSIGVLV